MNILCHIRVHATMTSRNYVTYTRVRKELYCSMVSFSTDSDEVEETEVYTNCKNIHTISIEFHHLLGNGRTLFLHEYVPA